MCAALLTRSITYLLNAINNNDFKEPAVILIAWYILAAAKVTSMT